jgi:hypothetical protein
MALTVNDFVSYDFLTEVLELSVFSKIDKWKLIFFFMNRFDFKKSISRKENLTPQKRLASFKKYVAELLFFSGISY